MERMYIQQALNYIEEHLKEEMDNTMLAQIAGYSEYHFLRIFRKNIGLTPADYIRKRRISEIVCRIGEERPISDIAFEYGFNSKENFTRAFKKEHNILPTEFKTVNCSLRLFQPFTFDSAELLPTVY
ncbi:MAG: helix-turn-helix transcriptional regulator, partial [Ruminococcaceae bacterium]|nr:helix-turn-helix transcriptional regulator [Oscillospiraceae bacterium]